MEERFEAMRLEESCAKTEVCRKQLGCWGLVSGLGLCLMKMIVGVLGMSEALVADGLYSLYQGYICGRWRMAPGPGAAGGGGFRRGPWPARLSRALGVIMAVCVADILFFSAIRLVRSAQGPLTEPSPYVLFAAIISILANHTVSLYGLCLETQRDQEDVRELSGSFRRAIMFSGIALVGAALSRMGWHAGDPLAAIVIALFLIKPVKGLLCRPWAGGDSVGNTGEAAHAGAGAS